MSTTALQPKGAFVAGKERMGYRTVTERPRCAVCAHVEYRVPSGASNDLWAWRCTTGVFGVQPTAICDKFEPKLETL